MKYFMPLLIMLTLTTALWAYPNPNATVRVTASGVYPIGTFGEVFIAGGGLLVDAAWHNVNVRNFSLGIQTGCWGFIGNDDKAEWAVMVPLFATMRYEIPLTFEYILSPGIYIGMTYTNGRFVDRYLETVNRAQFHPAIGAGLMLEQRVSQDFGIIYGANFILLYERKGGMYMAEARVGAYWRFR